MKIRIDHLDANPFRHIDRYPIREEKIAALRESISTTGFWDNLVGRQVGDRVQIAYGHHRREALLREYPAGYEIGIVVRDFDDDQMLKIMARENMEEWGSSASVEHETVRAVVEAYAAGQIELPAPSAQARGVRSAPSFARGSAGGPDRLRPYTAKTVADFLGWTTPSGAPQEKVEYALAALEYIEAGHLTDADFVGFSTKQAEGLVDTTRREVLEEQRRAEAAAEAAKLAAQRRAEADERAAEAAKEREAALARAREAKEAADRDRAEREYKARQVAAAEAEAAQQRAAQAAEALTRENARAEKASAAQRRQVTDTVRDDLRSGGGYKNARQTADRARQQNRDEDTAARDLGRTVRTLASQLASFFTDTTTARSLGLVLGYRQHFATDDRDQLINGLRTMRDRIDAHLNTLGATDGTEVVDGDVIDAEIV